MNIRLRYFAGAREATGLDSETIEIHPGTTLEALRTQLVERHPAVAPLVPDLRFAVGSAFAEGGQVLQDGDEVALIPPVGGG